MFATNGDYPPKSPLSKGDFPDRSIIVGWVEVTKPFGDPQGNAQQATKLVLGFARAQPNLQLLLISNLKMLATDTKMF